MTLNLQEAIKVINQVVFDKFYRDLTDIEMIIITGIWEGKEYEEIAVKHQYTTSYISQDVAPKLWRLLTNAMGKKVKKRNFKEVLQQYWEETCWDTQFINKYQSHHPEPMTYSQNKPLEVTLLAPEPEKMLTPELYVERYAIESLCYETLLHPGSMIRIKAPQLMGKTSLMNRVLANLAKHGYRTVNLSLEMADRQTHLSNLNKFLRWFCLNLSREFSLPNQLEDYWDEEGMGAKVSCTTYLEEHLLSAADTPLVLYLDDVDALFPYPEVYEDFFGLLRSWYEKARSRQNWKKLRLAIAHSTDVYIRLNINQSPFNVGLPIELPELTPEEVEIFAKKYGFTGDASLVEPLMQLVGGHPYLLQQALFYLKNYPNITLDQLLSMAPTNAGIYQHHLRKYWLNLQEEPKLIAAFQTVVNSAQPVRLETISAYQLQSMGLVKLVGNEVEARCQLYRIYFRNIMLV